MSALDFLLQWDSQPQEAVDVTGWAPGDVRIAFNAGAGIANTGNRSVLADLRNGAAFHAIGGEKVVRVGTDGAAEAVWFANGGRFDPEVMSGLVRWWIPTGAAAHELWVTTHDNNFGGGYELTADGASSTLNFNAKNAAVLLTTSNSTAPGWNTAAWSYRSSTGRLRVALNGVLTSATSVRSTTHTNIQLGRWGETGTTGNTDLHYQSLFLLSGAECLDDAFLTSVSRQLPWSLFAPRTIWVPVSAGGAATHATTGALAGAGAAVAGTAAHIAKHATTGALAGAGAAIDGTAARTRAHASDGILAGSGGVIDGTAARVTPSGEHATSGALAGAGAAVSGTAAHIATHQTSGALVGGGAVVDGAAARPSNGVGGGGSQRKKVLKDIKRLNELILKREAEAPIIEVQPYDESDDEEALMMLML